MGPEEEYADQKVDGPIELRVYPGANGAFQFYQDEGDNYDYEKGDHMVIPIFWSESDRTLQFGARVGSYPGMSQDLTFHIVWVKSSHGIGEAVEGRPDSTVVYHGSPVSVSER
jgi:alpha-D-xyloside xylohydrolase